jgi:hypothetical protein
MTFHCERLQRQAVSFIARAGVRFFGGAILVAAVLALAAGAARGQSFATDCELRTGNPGAEAPYLCESFRGPEGPRFHPLRPSADFSIATDFSLATELIPFGDSDTAARPPSAVALSPSAAVLFPAAVPAPEDQSAPYDPITGRGRLVWMVKNTLWPEHLLGGVITAGAGTALNRPHEYGPHWGGFGQRYGIRLTGIATSNVMEAGIGALWGEDPRYFRVPERSFGARVKNVVVMTFLARDRAGDFRPAYARYIAISGNNFLSNAWRADSEADVSHALLRTAEGFAGRMAGNAWSEFWPQAKAYIFHRGGRQP